MSTTNNPYISVVILIGAQRKRAEKALASVLQQDSLDQAEIIILDIAYGKYPPLAGSGLSSVKVLDCSSSSSYGSLRAQAVHNARGQVVAFLEEHALAQPGWLKALVRDFHKGYAGVGGSPEALNPGVGLSDVFSLINFGFLLTSSTPVNQLPVHNGAYRRDILLSFGNQLPMLLASDLLLSPKIIEKGFTLLADPEVKILHLNMEYGSHGLLAYYNWNIIFGRNRAQLNHWSLSRRIFQFLIIPLVPCIRYFKHLIHFIKYDRKKNRSLLLNTGGFLIVQSIAATGIGVGCLFAAKNAEAKFLDYELNHERSRISPTLNP